MTAFIGTFFKTLVFGSVAVVLLVFLPWLVLYGIGRMI